MTQTITNFPHGWLSPLGVFHDASGRPEYEDHEDIALAILKAELSKTAAKHCEEIFPNPCHVLEIRGWVYLNFGAPHIVGKPTVAQHQKVRAMSRKCADHLSKAAIDAFLELPHDKPTSQQVAAERLETCVG